MRVEGITHAGKVRKNNEDRYMIHNVDPVKFFIIADGMGGYKSGEVASSIAVDYVSRFLISELKSDDSLEKIEKCLVKAVSEANRTIFFKANDNPEFAGMGTTFLIAIVKDDEVVIGNIGDSRAYIKNIDSFRQITEDDSYVNELIKRGEITKEEAKNSSLNRFITKSMGNSVKINISLYREKISEGDLLLLCSDGLTNMVSDEKIDRIISGNDIHSSIELLLNEALSNGGVDNISSILIKF